MYDRLTEEEKAAFRAQLAVPVRDSAGEDAEEPDY